MVTRNGRALILLADDSPDDRLLAETLLEEAGLRACIEHASDGDEAIAFLSGQELAGGSLPDLVLLDLSMPRKGGIEVLQFMRTCSRFSAIPVIILTSEDNCEQRHRCAELGACDYLIKPSSYDDMREMIGHLAPIFA